MRPRTTVERDPLKRAAPAPVVIAAPKREPAAAPKPLGPFARFWVRSLFKWSRTARWAVAALRPLGVWVPVRVSEKVRDATFANARRLISPTLSDAECRKYAQKLCGRFIDHVSFIGRYAAESAEQLRSRIDGIEGHETFVAARSNGRGVIVITAHMGSFELGLAALTQIEPNVHVVFKRDDNDHFETARRTLRQTLGVQEAAIDDGWTTWLQLRDALRQNHVVVLQADRAMPAQRSLPVPFAGGHLAIPLGPLKLAMASGSPIVPIFTLTTAPGRARVIVEKPIIVDPNAPDIDGVHPALLQIGRAIEQQVLACPDQWLVMHRAFVEDQP